MKSNDRNFFISLKRKAAVPKQPSQNRYHNILTLLARSLCWHSLLLTAGKVARYPSYIFLRTDEKRRREEGGARIYLLGMLIDPVTVLGIVPSLKFHWGQKLSWRSRKKMVNHIYRTKPFNLWCWLEFGRLFHQESSDRPKTLIGFSEVLACKENISKVLRKRVRIPEVNYLWLTEWSNRSFHLCNISNQTDLSFLRKRPD